MLMACVPPKTVVHDSCVFYRTSKITNQHIVTLHGIKIGAKQPSLKRTASLPLKIGRLPPQKKETRKYSNHPFSGAKMLISGRVSF